MAKLRVGFIGLGLMGGPMAQNILKAGFKLTAFNRSPEKMRMIRERGGIGGNSPKEVAENSDVVITMVTGPKDVRQVLFGKDGVVMGAKSGLMVIDMSTIGPQAAKEIGDDLKNFQIDFLDAPVTGSVDRAKSGELTIFVGGEKKVFEKVKSVLRAMGKDLQYMGSQGSGQAIKMINNMIIAVGLAGLAEGVLLADSMDLDRKKILGALEKTTTLSPNMKMKLPKMVSEDFSTAFSMKNMDKDLKLALSEAEKRKSPVLKLVEKYFAKASKNGFEKEDIAAVIKTLET